MKFYLKDIFDIYVKDISDDEELGDTVMQISFYEGEDLLLYFLEHYIEDIIPDTTHMQRKIEEQQRKIDALQNEVNAVEWVNGRMERELEAALRKCS